MTCGAVEVFLENNMVYSVLLSALKMRRTCNQATAAPRKLLSTLTTPLKLISPRHQKTHASTMPTESRGNVTMQINQNEKDMDAEIEDDDDDNESVLMMGELM